MNAGDNEKYEAAAEELRKDEKKLSVSGNYDFLANNKETRESPVRCIPFVAELG
jgi:hypothetical protein